MGYRGPGTIDDIPYISDRDSLAAARVFSFNCQFSGDTLNWSVVGTVTLNA